MASSVADVMVATLKASGTRRVYGIPGDSLNGFTDAMRRADGIAWQHVRHEEAAAFAAAAEAALTGELAVCAASCGPGNLHLINGLFDANRSRVPVLAIAAQIPGDEIGSEYFQETHPQILFRECSVYCELVSEPEQMPRVLEIAMRTALARGGVSVVVIPGEVFFADVPSGAKAVPVRAANAVIRPDDSSLAAAAEILNSAPRVTILAGAGCAGAHQQLIDLAGALQAPVVHAFRGKEFIEYDNRFDVGMTGLIGFSSGYRAMEHCDALLMLGTDFPYRPFYPRGVPVVQVDVRGEQIGRRVPVDNWEKAPVPGQVGKRLIEGFTQRELPDRWAWPVSTVMHWSYGSAWGAFYGVLAGSLRRPHALYGLPFGAAVWVSGYLILPAGGLYQPIWEYDAKTLATDLSAHLAYGAGTGAAFSLLVKIR